MSDHPSRPVGRVLRRGTAEHVTAREAVTTAVVVEVDNGWREVPTKVEWALSLLDEDPKAKLLALADGSPWPYAVVRSPWPLWYLLGKAVSDA